MNMSTVMKGTAVGIAAGCVTCIVAGNSAARSRHKKAHMMQKKAQHAVKTIGGAVEELADIIK